MFRIDHCHASVKHVSKRIIIFILEVFMPIPGYRGDWNGSLSLSYPKKEWRAGALKTLRSVFSWRTSKLLTEWITSVPQNALHKAPFYRTLILWYSKCAMLCRGLPTVWHSLAGWCMARVMRKQTLRSLSLSYQRRMGARGHTHPSFGMTLTFREYNLWFQQS